MGKNLKNAHIHIYNWITLLNTNTALGYSWFNDASALGPPARPDCYKSFYTLVLSVQLILPRSADKALQTHSPETRLWVLLDCSQAGLQCLLVPVLGGAQKWQTRWKPLNELLCASFQSQIPEMPTEARLLIAGINKVRSHSSLQSRVDWFWHSWNVSFRTAVWMHLTNSSACT